jgi:hypothetical protein
MHIYESRLPFSDISDYPLGGLLASWLRQRDAESGSLRLLPGRAISICA